MRFNDTNDNIFAATVAANTLTQHAIGLSNAGCVAEKDLEYALLFLRSDFFQPLFRALLHEFIVI